METAANPRFWAKVDKSDDCWLWIGETNTKAPYGIFNLNRKKIRAHRLSYIMHFGDIAPGLDVCHRCDNPRCVRPDHLFLGTRGENNADRAAKGRSASKEKHGRSKLTELQVAEIRSRDLSAWGSQAALAREFGVSHTQIQRIRAGQHW